MGRTPPSSRHSGGPARPRPASATRKPAAAPSPTRPTHPEPRPSSAPQDKSLTSRLEKIDARFSTPRLDYVILASIVTILTGLGLLMVLSSSMAWSLEDNHSVWTEFLKQSVMVAVGLVAMYITLRIQPATLKKLAPWIFGGAVVLLILIFVPGIGTGLEAKGSQSWIAVKSISIQPSEIAKLAVAIWGSQILSDRLQRGGTPKEVFGLFSVGAVSVIALVVAERDLGMVASIFIVILALAWFVGLPSWIPATITLGAVILFAILTFTVGFRSTRITVFRETLVGHFTDKEEASYQSYQGFLSLGDGSLFGQGLGQSHSKWFYLPEAKNDFIFAIVGEEMGMMGAGIVILLFGIFGWVGIKIAMNQTDPFLRLLAGTVTMGIVVQAFVNIGYVIGILPVTGIQLPLISAGGTSAIVTLASMGLLLNCARHEPPTISAMQSYGLSMSDRILRLPMPKPYQPPERRVSTAHHEPQRFGQPVTSRQWATDRPSRPEEASGRPPRVGQRPVGDSSRRPRRQEDAAPQRSVIRGRSASGRPGRPSSRQQPGSAAATSTRTSSSRSNPAVRRKGRKP